jgi:hypothetical protein
MSDPRFENSHSNHNFETTLKDIASQPEGLPITQFLSQEQEFAKFGISLSLHREQDYQKHNIAALHIQTTPHQAVRAAHISRTEGQSVTVDTSSPTELNLKLSNNGSYIIQFDIGREIPLFVIINVNRTRDGVRYGVSDNQPNLEFILHQIAASTDLEDPFEREQDMFKQAIGQAYKTADKNEISEGQGARDFLYQVIWQKLTTYCALAEIDLYHATNSHMVSQIWNMFAQVTGITKIASLNDELHKQKPEQSENLVSPFGGFVTTHNRSTLSFEEKLALNEEIRQLSSKYAKVAEILQYVFRHEAIMNLSRPGEPLDPGFEPTLKILSFFLSCRSEEELLEQFFTKKYGRAPEELVLPFHKKFDPSKLSSKFSIREINLRLFKRRYREELVTITYFYRELVQTLGLQIEEPANLEQGPDELDVELLQELEQAQSRLES